MLWGEAMMDRLFYWMLRRRWNLRALDLAISYAIQFDDWNMPDKIKHLRRIQQDVVKAGQ